MIQTAVPSSVCMMRSMTGQGRAEVSGEVGSIVVEIRSVNHRGLKVNVRTNEQLSSHENEIDALVRQRVARGTVTVHANLKPPIGGELPVVNTDVIRCYLQSLVEVYDSIDFQHASKTDVVTIDMASMLALPGVTSRPSDEDALTEKIKADRSKLLAAAVSEALDQFDDMRRHEASVMSRALSEDLQIIRLRCELIANMAPQVVTRYRERLKERVEKALAEHAIPSEPVDLIRETQLFADRADISEEITRMSSHVDLFADVIRGNSKEKTTAVGRKLDFIVQEMFREANTIGSKASDAEISMHVVEVKCAIERMRELVQNME